MVEAPFLRRDSSRRGGFTLIEVVVALAIFVFGAVAIIRIFPSALGVIQNSGDRLTAININRSVVAVYSREPNLVPDAVYDDKAFLPNGVPDPMYQTTWRDGLVGSVAGSPRRNNSIPRGTLSGGNDSSGFSNDVETAYNFSALGHSKNIAGEKHLIANNGSVLTQFRFNTTVTPSVFREDTVSGVTFNTVTNKLEFINATKDSDGTGYDPITVPVSPLTNPALKDSLYVSYQYISGGRVWATEDEPIRTFGSVVTPTYSLSHPSPVAGSLKMRIRQPITLLIPPKGQFGAIDFNGAKDEAGNAVTFGIVVSVDYRVEDWRWLIDDEVPTLTSEDNDVPSNYPPVATQDLKTIQLPVRPLDDNQPPSPYVYVFFPSTTPANDFGTSTTADPTIGPLYAVNAKRGRIVFDVSQSATKPVASKARVVYRTSDNWANQLSVAARSYLLSSTGPSLEPWRDCAFDSTNNANNYLYFKPNEAGKTLRVSYSYLDSGGVERKIDGRVVTIDNTLIDVASTTLGLPSNFAIGGRVSALELTGINGETLTSATPVVALREIKGVSIQSRTAWLDGNAFNQASSVAFRQGNN